MVIVHVKHAVSNFSKKDRMAAVFIESSKWYHLTSDPL